MTTSYDEFFAAVNEALLAKGLPALAQKDHSTVVHCFGYGNSVEMTVANVLHGRTFRTSFDIQF